MYELSGCIDRSVDEEFDAFSEVLDEIDGLSLYDFLDAATMNNPRLGDVCDRLFQYLEVSTDDDTRFALVAGINFAVTITSLAGYRTDRVLDIIGETLDDYQGLSYTDAQQKVIQAADELYDNNPNLDGLTQAYLLTDIQEKYYDGSPELDMDATKLASRLSSGLAFLALEQQANADSLIADVTSFLQSTMEAQP